MTYDEYNALESAEEKISASTAPCGYVIDLIENGKETIKSGKA